MSERVDDWLEQHAQRAIARQRAQVDTAKLLTTFAAAVAATIVGTALQVGDLPTVLDYTATFALGAAFLLAVSVILLDRLTDVDYEHVITLAAVSDSTLHDVIMDLRRAGLAAERFNRSVVSLVWITSGVQVACAAISGAFAAASLLAGSA